MTRSLLIAAFALLVGCDRSPSRIDPPVQTAAVAAVEAGSANTIDPIDEESSDVAINVEQPTDAAPVMAAAALSSTDVHPGKKLSLVIRTRIAPGWHIYALGGASGPNQPTHIKLTLPTGIATGGPWEAPTPVNQMTPMGLVHVYKSDVLFSRQLSVSAAANFETDSITCKLHYQACDHTRCLRPDVVRLAVPLARIHEKE